MNKTVEVLPDQPALVARSLELILSKLETAIEQR
ncbi:MAG: 6-phosphogluconolactonase, partial [Nostoc sp.]